MTITTQQTDQWAADVDYWRKKYTDLGLQYDLLQQRIKELERDAKRLDWLRDTLFTHKWNGVVGSGCAVRWKVVPDFLFRQRDLSDDSGIMAGDFRRAVDRAMSEAALTKAVEISQEYKLP